MADQPKSEPGPGPSAAILDSSCDIDNTTKRPLVSALRLRQPDASPPHLPSEPVPASGFFSAGEDAAGDTVLYLAYGSNLCAATFEGRRGIRPVAQLNVSAPALRLVFDLPGVPYIEPCFANTAPRRVPKPPPIDPPSPPKVPDLPDLPDPPAAMSGGPVWDKGLIGVVYEVTRADYARIMATEGGGSSYLDILVPCLPLPPPGSKPAIPKPFLAHTLCKPRLPLEKKADDDGKTKLPRWLRRLVMPVQRPDPDYAQPSARYLGLLRDGAREHELPADYQAYLAALRPYEMTTVAQRVGMVLFVVLFGLPFAAAMLLGQLLVDDRGRVPTWYAMLGAAVANMVWKAYDGLFAPVFGDGERTETRRAPWCWHRGEEGSGLVGDEEKRCLLGG